MKRGGPLGAELTELLRARIRDVPDFPKPGIVFKDITPLLADHMAFSAAIDGISSAIGRGTVDSVVGIEARGFIIAAPVAYNMAAGFVPVRKRGKLPWDSEGVSYELEYGSETLEIHRDGVGPGHRVAIVDDVLATGGTAEATAQLVEGLGATVVAMAFLIEIGSLKGRDRLAKYEPVSLLVC